MAGRDDLPVPTPPPVVVVHDEGLQLSEPWSFGASARQLDPLATKGEQALGPESPDDREAWLAYDATPEVNQMVSASAGLLSQCRLYDGWVDGQDEEHRLRDEEGEVDKAFAEAFALVPSGRAGSNVAQFVADCEATLARFVDQGGSQRGLLLAQAENIDVTGDSYMVGWPVDENGKPFEGTEGDEAGERWEVVSRGALGRAYGRWTLQLGGERAVKLPEGTTMVYRMWRKHPRRPDDSRGWVKASLEVIRDLRVFSTAARSAARSNIPAKILVTAQEASPKNLTQPGGPGGGNVPAPAPAFGPNMAGAQLLNPFAQPGAPGSPPAQPVSWAQTLERLIGDAVMEVLKDAQSGRAVVPAVLAVAKDFVDKWHELDLSRDVPEILVGLVELARQRLRESADNPPEMLSGLGETNRWNGAQIADDEYRRYFRPKAMAIADAWTVELLWGGLLALGWEPEQVRLARVLVDPQGVVAPPDRQAIATEGLKMGAIGFAAWRRECGFADTDAPTPEELETIQDLFGRRMNRDSSGTTSTGEVNRQAGSAGPPALVAEVAPAEPQEAPVAPEPAPEPTPGRRPALAGLRTRTTASTVQPLSAEELSEQLALIEQNARGRLEEATEAAYGQAVARAGAKLKTWGRKDQDVRALLARVDAADVAHVLGPRRCLAVVGTQFATDGDRREDLFAAALVALLGSFGRIAGSAYRQALAVLGVTLSDEQIAANVTAGSENLRASMLLLADERVFAPPAGAGRNGSTSAANGGAAGPGEPEGGLSAIRVPTSVTRRAMAVAGGGRIEPGTGPLEHSTTGIVFGPTLAALSPDRLGFEWIYGEASTRRAPWEPHLAVGGRVFSGPDDPALLGLAPDGGMGFPGDHDGCQCDWMVKFRTGLGG